MAKSRRLYSRKDISTILGTVVGRRDIGKYFKYTHEIETIARAFLTSRYIARRPSSATLIKELQAVRRADAPALGRARQRAQGQSTSSMYLIFALRQAAARAGYVDPIAAVNTALRSRTKIDIRRIAENAIAYERARRAHRRRVATLTAEMRGVKGLSRHEGNVPLNRLLQNLAGVYLDFFRRMPGSSVASPRSRQAGKVRGPFVRFIQACYAPLMRVDPSLRPLSDNSIRDRMRRYVVRASDLAAATGRRTVAEFPRAHDKKGILALLATIKRRK